MTLLSYFGIVPPHRGNNTAPCHLDLSELSIVVPVKDNQQGIRHLLMACLKVFSPHHCPKEIILVDNRSQPPLTIPAWASSWLPLRTLICSQPGPAAARNMGARQTTGEWILFLDSDCQPTNKLIKGYQQALNGAVAYAGTVQAKGADLLSHYYDMQRILIPPPLLDEGGERPNFLITANALVWREAFIQIGGFDEQFHEAGGEDIDLGLRLWSIGQLSYAPQALVIHTFEPSLIAFLRRFARYGRANRRLSNCYHADLTPRPFTPVVETSFYRLLAKLQFFALRWGYATARLKHIPSSRDNSSPIFCSEKPQNLPLLK